MAGLNQAHSKVVKELQNNISMAESQLDNIVTRLNKLIDTPDFNKPTSPTIKSPNPDFPNRPPEPKIKDVSFENVSVTGVSAKTPSTGGVRAPSVGGPPSAELLRTGFEEFFTGDEDTPEETIARANKQVSDWVDNYFPAIKNCFENVPEQWVCDVISGVRPLGNSEEAIEVAWRVAKANQNRDTQSAKKTLYAEFASRGFSLPPGAMVAAMERLHERGMDLSSAASRDAALKDVDVQAQLLQTAVQTGANLKQGMLQIMATYYRVTTALNNDTVRFGIDKARIKAQADTQFNDAMLRFQSINQDYFASLRSTLTQHNSNEISLFNARVGASQTEAQVADTAARVELEAAKINAQNKQVEVQSNTEIERLKADVFNTTMQGESTKVSTETAIETLKLEKFASELKGEVARVEAEVAGIDGKARALGGVAAAFGEIAGAAANAQGSLIARIEGV